MKWPLNSGVGYAGVCSQYAGEGTERRDWRLKRIFLKEFIHFKLWGSAQAVKQVFGWLIRFFICCVFFLFGFLVSQVKACTATWLFIVIFVLYFLKHDFLVKRHVSHRFYSSKCQCNCISVILTSPYSCC